MTSNDVLKALFDHLRTTDHSVLIGWDAVQQWPGGALDVNQRAKLPVSAYILSSI